MISELPIIKLPGPMTQLCSLDLKNTKNCHGQIIMIVEKDPFLSVFVKKALKEFSGKGGLATILNNLGWQGFRNRLAEAYLHYAKNGRYPNFLELKEVLPAIELERRFDFLFAENNARMFLLGMYLKLCEIEFENNDYLSINDYQGISHEVDQILSYGKSKIETPDWLVVSVWSLYNRVGKTKCLEYFQAYKGDFEFIMKNIPKKEYGDFMMDLLVYGHAINDNQFFAEERV